MAFLDKFKNNLPKERVSSGLDIGSYSIKVVKLTQSQDNAEVTDLKSFPLQGDLQELIGTIARSQGNTKVNISFSGPASIIRYAQFLTMSDNELRQSLKFEAQKHIPFPISEVYVDAGILKTDLPDGKMLVLLAAVKKDVLNQRLKIIESAGLKVGVVDLDSLALINSFRYSYSQEEDLKEKTVALLNIGAWQSNLNILENLMPRFSRDIPIAGNQFTQKIADVFNISAKEAEALKLDPEKAKQQKCSSGMEPVFSNLAGEIRVSCDYYESQNASTVSRIFLSGAGSRFPGLKEALESVLGLEVAFWNPMRGVQVSKALEPQKIEEISFQYAVAMGLALRG